jgi:hypothetical protein
MGGTSRYDKARPVADREAQQARALLSCSLTGRPR